MITFAKIGAVPIFILRFSPCLIGVIFMSSVVPTAESNKLVFNFVLSKFSGNVSGFPMTDPINESLLVKDGSNYVPIATNPPGLTISTVPAPVPNETISVWIGSYDFFFSPYNPGLISISSPT